MEQFNPENMISIAQILNECIDNLKKEDIEYERRLKIYAKRKERREKGEKGDPVDNYKVYG